MLLALFIFFQFSSIAPAQTSVETLVWQPAVLPPHASTANLSSIESWNGRSAKAIFKKIDSLGTVFEFISEHDMYGFRKTGKPAASSKPNFHLFLNGCSWTYGIGVAGDKTFAAHLEAKRPRYRVVNMAAGGGSPAEALYIWRNFNWHEVFPESEGLLVYTLIDAHVGRLKRTWRYLSWGAPTAPVFDEALVQSRPSREFYDYKWAKLVKSSGLDYMWLRGTAHFRKKNPPDFAELIVRYMLAIKTEYLKRYPKGRFVISWMRQEALRFTDQQLQSLTAALDKAGIEYWHPTEPLRYKEQDYGILRDGHPTELAHSEFAKFLLTRIP